MAEIFSPREIRRGSWLSSVHWLLVGALLRVVDNLFSFTPPVVGLLRKLVRDGL